MPYLGNKEQKCLFLVFSLSGMHIDFDFVCPFFCRARSGAQIKLHGRNIGHVQANLSSPEKVILGRKWLTKTQLLVICLQAKAYLEPFQNLRWSFL